MPNNVGEVTQSEQDKKIQALIATLPVSNVTLEQYELETRIGVEDASLTTAWS